MNSHRQHKRVIMRHRLEAHVGTEENKRLMEQVFAELALGNSQALVEVLADDIDWHVTRTTKFSRTYSGKQPLINDPVGPLFSMLADRFVWVAQRIIAD